MCYVPEMAALQAPGAQPPLRGFTSVLLGNVMKMATVEPVWGALAAWPWRWQWVLKLEAWYRGMRAWHLTKLARAMVAVFQMSLWLTAVDEVETSGLVRQARKPDGLLPDRWRSELESWTRWWQQHTQNCNCPQGPHGLVCVAVEYV